MLNNGDSVRILKRFHHDVGASLSFNAEMEPLVGTVQIVEAVYSDRAKAGGWHWPLDCLERATAKEAAPVFVAEPNQRRRQHPNLPRLYLSGPISIGDSEHNFAQAGEAQHALLRAGFAVLNPMLTMSLPRHETVAHGDWLDADFPWLESANLVVRLPGESVGADAEVAHAAACGIPVVEIGEGVVDWGEVVAFSRDLLRQREAADLATAEIWEDTGPQFSQRSETPRAAILAEAVRLIDGARDEDYGPPTADFERIAAMWSALFGREFAAHEVAMAVACVKLSRICKSPKKRDHWVDLAGYAGCGYECADNES